MIELFEKFKFSNVVFHEEEHKYFDGETQYKSVTTLLKQFSQFDSDSISKFVAKAQNRSQESVLHEWSSSGHKGTLSHLYIENRLKNKIVYGEIKEEYKQYGLEDSLNTIYRQIDSFIDYIKDSFVPIFSEFVVSDKEYLIAGTIDQIFYNKKTGKFHVFDWKTSKDLTKKSKKKLSGILSHIDNTKTNTYSLQTSIYRYICEKYTGIDFGESYIVWFIESNKQPEIIKCNDYREEAFLILEDHKSKID
jgi:hypothetical protein